MSDGADSVALASVKREGMSRWTDGGHAGNLRGSGRRAGTPPAGHHASGGPVPSASLEA